MQVAARGRSSRGGSIVELALSLPILLLLILGVADIGRAYYYKEAVANAARQALRIAVSSSQQATGNTVCTSSGGTASATIPAASSSPIKTIADAAAVESSSNGTPSGSAIYGATVTVKWHCIGNLAVTNSTNSGVTDPASTQSDAIEVSVSDSMTLVTRTLQSLLGSSTTIRVDVVGRTQY